MTDILIYNQQNQFNFRKRCIMLCNIVKAFINIVGEKFCSNINVWKVVICIGNCQKTIFFVIKIHRSCMRKVRKVFDPKVFSIYSSKPYTKIGFTLESIGNFSSVLLCQFYAINGSEIIPFLAVPQVYVFSSGRYLKSKIKI